MRLGPLVATTLLSTGAVHGESASCANLGRYSPPRRLPRVLDPDKAIAYPLALAHEYAIQHSPTALNIDRLTRTRDLNHAGKPMLVKPGKAAKLVIGTSHLNGYFEWNPDVKILFASLSSIESRAVSAANALFQHEVAHALGFHTHPGEFYFGSCLYHPTFNSMEEFRVGFERRNSEPDEREGRTPSHLGIPAEAECVIDTDAPFFPDKKEDVLSRLNTARRKHADNATISTSECDNLQPALGANFVRLRETSELLRKAVSEGRSIDPHTLTNYENDVIGVIHDFSGRGPASQ